MQNTYNIMLFSTSGVFKKNFAREPLKIPQDSAVYIHHMADITSMQKPREMIAVYLLKECGFGLV